MSMETLSTTTYDGEVFTSHDEKHPSKHATAANLRRKVRYHLRTNGLCRLPDNHDLLSKNR
jgi:hypothetical protein